MSSTAHWDNYWQSSSSLNSFGEGEAAKGYEGELLAVWHSCFKQLSENATVVDVGTGNGAIAVAARKYSDSQQLNFSVYGTDAANIEPLQAFANNPEIAGLLRTITFYPQCKTEQLPFADGTVDLVTSQFAFEYAERAAALQECIRVLKPAGHFTAIMHHAESEIARDSAAGLRILTAFLSETAFFQRARLLLTCMAEQTQRPDKPEIVQRTQQANQQLLQISQQIKLEVPAAYSHWYNDVMARVAKLIISFSAASIVKLEAEQQGLTLYCQRLSDQQQASMSAEGAAVFRQQLTAAGYSYKLSELNIENQLFGWLLKIQK
ncbi:Methyltransferase domain-containing protein [Arsukibacterium tuosuense]|uniref:Methyltransferase domain-containing protein n=1 Tax=Arsukibacterium tuosuense TaxID=1323745 RepID=A0A285J853_9GAMM|nr:class I SAM-dependent methyltransferase [Arsukibacterium tuosuense]SNY55291.1 Methyltransferase domain-containing protein [Arsukibacterium tuosuense]